MDSGTMGTRTHLTLAHRENVFEVMVRSDMENEFSVTDYHH